MTLGQGANLHLVLRELSNILFVSGARTIAATVKGSTTLREAVDAVVLWCQGRVCLFLVDDLWPTKTCKTCFLLNLRQLLRDGPASRMAISTRSTDIAECTGAVVQFGAREPFSTVSLNIVNGSCHAWCVRENFGGQAPGLRNSVQIILDICARLRIALGVTGSAFAKNSKACRDFDTASDTYATRLRRWWVFGRQKLECLYSAEP